MFKESLIRGSVIVTILLLTLYSKKWFNFVFEIYSIKISFYFYLVSLIISYILLEYNVVRQKQSLEFYKLTFWLFSISSLALFYFSFLKIFIINPQNVQDNITLCENIKITLQFTIEYKYYFAKNYQTYLVLTDNTFSLICDFMTLLIKDKTEYTFISEEPQITLDGIRFTLYTQLCLINFINENIYTILEVYENHENSNNSLQTNIYSFFKNVLVISTMVYIIKYTLPVIIIPGFIQTTYNFCYWLASNYYVTKSINIVTKIYAEHNVSFSMSTLEKADFLAQSAAVLIYIDPAYVIMYNETILGSSW